MKTIEYLLLHSNYLNPRRVSNCIILLRIKTNHHYDHHYYYRNPKTKSSLYVVILVGMNCAAHPRIIFMISSACHVINQNKEKMNYCIYLSFLLFPLLITTKGNTTNQRKHSLSMVTFILKSLFLSANSSVSRPDMQQREGRQKSVEPLILEVICMWFLPHTIQQVVVVVVSPFAWSMIAIVWLLELKHRETSLSGMID